MRHLPPSAWVRGPGQPGLERAVAISRDTVGSTGLYSSVVTTPPGSATQIHHHDRCETSIYVIAGRARFTWGPTGVEDEVFAGPGDVVYVPAHELHVEQNASSVDALVVLVTRDCAEAVTVVPGAGA